MKVKDMRKENAKGKMVKKASVLMVMVMLLTMSWGSVAFAGNNYVQNFFTGTLQENLLWIGIIATLFAVIGAAVKKNYIVMAISFFIGAIACFLIMSPEKIKDVGTAIGGSFGF